MKETLTAKEYASNILKQRKNTDCTDCTNCRHSHKWTAEEKAEYIRNFTELVGRPPCDFDHYLCDKITKGTPWTVEGNTLTYDGYSIEGENYDEVFHCFEPKDV